MINLELELRKCRERTKDESVVLLMMQAKVDLLDETYYHNERNELFWWVQTQAVHAAERAAAQKLRPELARV